MSGMVPTAPERQVFLVSACLLGVACNHRGEAKASPAVVALGQSAQLIPVCPEVAGGLPTPRPAAERAADGRVRSETGEDVTDFYQRGAAQAVAVAGAARATVAILKARSPSCGTTRIYDGTHRGVLVEGAGVTAEALQAAGLRVVSEEDLQRHADSPDAVLGGAPPAPLPWGPSGA